MLSIFKMKFLVFFFVLLGVKSGLGLYETCKKNSDCSTSNALCINAKCACDDLSYYNNSRCLPYATKFNAICYEQDQCDWLGENSECRHNRCVCSENFRWYKGMCQKYVDKGEPCESDDECYNGYDLLSLTCSSEGICECRTGYYDRGHDCRKSSILKGDCALTIDCQSSLLECVLGKCSLKSNNSASEQHSVIFDENITPSVKISTLGADVISCENDDNCRDMANSLCDISNKMCGCNEDTHYLYNGNCVEGLSHCENATDCADSNTMCFNNTCICQRGFFLKDKKCIAELGIDDPNTSYEADTDCPIKPGQLVDSTCYCRNYWFNDESNQNCIKTMIETSLNCLTNEWCAAMGPYSFCDSRSSTCQCSSIAKFNESTYYCDYSSNDTVACLKDANCEINERCLDEECVCSEIFSRNDDNTCMPNIGGSCSTESCSHIENAYCVGGTCVCDNDYVGKETKCLRNADSLESPCEEQEQCQALEHAVCGEPEIEYVISEYNNTLRCICEQGYTNVNDMCRQIKKYGDPCMTEAECTLVLNRSYKCRNSQCQCNVGFSLKNGYCSSAGNIVLGNFLVWLAILIKLRLC